MGSPERLCWVSFIQIVAVANNWERNLFQKRNEAIIYYPKPFGFERKLQTEDETKNTSKSTENKPSERCHQNELWENRIKLSALLIFKKR